jgi:hypothetical protein
MTLQRGNFRSKSRVAITGRSNTYAKINNAIPAAPNNSHCRFLPGNSLFVNADRLCREFFMCSC